MYVYDGVVAFLVWGWPRSSLSQQLGPYTVSPLHAYTTTSHGLDCAGRGSRCTCLSFCPTTTAGTLYFETTLGCCVCLSRHFVVWVDCNIKAGLRTSDWIRTRTWFCTWIRDIVCFAAAVTVTIAAAVRIGGRSSIASTPAFCFLYRDSPQLKFFAAHQFDFIHLYFKTRRAAASCRLSVKVVEGHRAAAGVLASATTRMGLGFAVGRSSSCVSIAPARIQGLGARRLSSVDVSECFLRRFVPSLLRSLGRFSSPWAHHASVFSIVSRAIHLVFQAHFPGQRRVARR